MAFSLFLSFTMNTTSLQPSGLLSLMGFCVFFSHFLPAYMNTISLQAVSWHQDTCWTTSRWGQRLCSLNRPDRLCGPTVLPSSSCRVWSGRIVKLITHLGLVPSLRVFLLYGAWLSLRTAILWFQLPSSGKCLGNTSNQDRTAVLPRVPIHSLLHAPEDTWSEITVCVIINCELAPMY
jgi:hypothetical protein